MSNIYLNSSYEKKRPFVNLGIGIGIETDVINAIISTYVRPIVPKLNRVVTQNEGTTLTKSCDHVTNKKRYMSTFTKPMAPKLSKVVAQNEETTPTKLHDTLIRGK